jgi:hypothetical protein
MTPDTFEAARARIQLQQAESELRLAEDLTDSDCGVAVGAALMNRIRRAQRRVKAAKAALQRVELTSSRTG